MSDVAMIWNQQLAGMDMAIVDDDIAVDAGLETSVLHSLFADRRASDEDVLLKPEDRRGHWADQFSEVEGDQIGSRLWQLERSLLTPDVEVQTDVKTREGLEWMIADRIASTIDVETTTDDATRSMCLAITINRPSGEAIDFRYQSVWEAQDAMV